MDTTTRSFFQAALERHDSYAFEAASMLVRPMANAKRAMILGLVMERMPTKDMLRHPGLAVSRQAIQKHLDALRTDGIIEGNTRQGYQATPVGALVAGTYANLAKHAAHIQLQRIGVALKNTQMEAVRSATVLGVSTKDLVIRSVEDFEQGIDLALARAETDLPSEIVPGSRSDVPTPTR